MKVLLVDDHALFRGGLVLLLEPLAASSELWQAGSVEEGLALVDEYGPPDLVLIDLGLPGLTGMQGLQILRERFPQTQVVVLSSADDRDTVLAALESGAMGFIPKSTSPDVLIGALRLVLARGIYLPPSVFLPGKAEATGVVGAGVKSEFVFADSAPPPGRHARDLGLSPRQVEVLYLLLQGQSAKQICRALAISPGTVKVHTSAVLRALNVTTRTQAVIQAGKLGLRFGD